jgi:hypothetical protein
VAVHHCRFTTNHVHGSERMAWLQCPVLGWVLPRSSQNTKTQPSGVLVRISRSTRSRPRTILIMKLEPCQPWGIPTPNTQGHLNLRLGYWAGSVTGKSRKMISSKYALVTWQIPSHLCYDLGLSHTRQLNQIDDVCGRGNSLGREIADFCRRRDARRWFCSFASPPDTPRS